MHYVFISALLNEQWLNQQFINKTNSYNNFIFIMKYFNQYTKTTIFRA